MKEGKYEIMIPGRIYIYIYGISFIVILKYYFGIKYKKFKRLFLKQNKNNFKF